MKRLLYLGHNMVRHKRVWTAHVVLAKSSKPFVQQVRRCRRIGISRTGCLRVGRTGQPRRRRSYGLLR